MYCVTTEIAQDAAARPGPVMPTEDWAERETLSSKTGWVEVHVSNNGCIVSVYRISIDAIRMPSNFLKRFLFYVYTFYIDFDSIRRPMWQIRDVTCP